MEIFAVLTVCIVLLFITWKVLQWITFCADRSIPGPRGLPCIGSVLSINPEKMHLSFYKWALKYGSLFRVKVFGQTVVVVNDFNEVRKLFADKEQVEYFNNRPETFVGKFAAFETSDIVLSMENNEKFMILKKLLQKCLKRRDQSESFHFNFNAEMDRLEEEFESYDNVDFEFNPVIRHSLANLVSVLMSGEGVSKQASKRLWEFNDNAFYLLETSVNLFLTTFPFARYFPGKLGTVYKRMISSRDWIIEKYFEKCKSDSDADGGKGLVYDLLEVQCKENKERGYTFITDENIKGIVLDMIVAAMKAINSAVAACFLILLNNPDYVGVIQKEIDEVVGVERRPDADDQAKMPFCRAFVYELLRYISHGGLGLPHLITKDCNLNGHQFRKNDICLSNIWFIHHNPYFWDRPWEFCPARFLDNDGFLLPASNQKIRAIATFSVGRRVCAGKDIAFTRIFLYLTNILQKFDILPPVTGSLTGTDPRDFIPGLFLEPNLFSCRFVRRDGQQRTKL